MIWRNNISLATITSTSRWFLVFVPSFVSFYLRLESFTYRFSPPQAPSSSTFFVLKYRFSFVVIYFLFFSATIVGVQHYYCPFSTYQFPLAPSSFIRDTILHLRPISFISGHSVWKFLKQFRLNFPPIFVLLKLICLVTLFDCKLQVFKNSPEWTIFGVVNQLLSTQNVNVARFARNVEWDFFCDFQSPVWVS